MPNDQKPPSGLPVDEESKVLDFVATQGAGAMAEVIEQANMIQRESNTTLALFITGGAVSLTYAFVNATMTPNMRMLFAAASAVLFGLAWAVLYFCLALRPYPASFNTPDNLLQDGYTANALRRFELKNLSARIEESKNINDERAQRLNQVRGAALALLCLLGVAGSVLAFAS